MRGSKRERRPGVWELRVYVGLDERGRQRYRSRTVHGTARDADLELAELLLEVAGDRHAEPADSLAALLRRWLVLVERDRSPSTVRGYRGYVERRIVPELGRRPVDELTAAELDRFYLDLERDGLAPASVRQVHAIIRRALGQAVRWGMVARNVAEAASPPPQRRVERQAPPRDVVEQLVAAAEGRDHVLGVAYRLAAATGMRRGELAGLRWSAVDLEGAELVVRANVVMGPRGPAVKEPKGRQARRVALSSSTVAALVAHRDRCRAVCATLGVPWPADGWLLSSEPDGSVPLDPTVLSDGWRRLCRREGVTGVRLHDLRHAHATDLIAAGVPVTTVAGRLGHANTATTLAVYAHAVAAVDRAAADLWDELSPGARNGPAG